LSKARLRKLEKIIKCANEFYIYKIIRGSEELDINVPFKLFRHDSNLPRLDISFIDEADIRNEDKVYIKATIPEREDVDFEGICKKSDGKYASIIVDGYDPL